MTNQFDNVKCKRHRCSLCGSQRKASLLRPTGKASANQRDQSWLCIQCPDAALGRVKYVQLTIDEYELIQEVAAQSE